MSTISPGAEDALLIIDVQNDFLPGGALAVPDGNHVIAPLNHLAKLGFGCVVATQDWHPIDHMSFVEQGGPWPPHCRQSTYGAALASALNQAPIGYVIRKGREAECDSYSAFFDNDGEKTTGLDGLLRALAVKRVFIGGLATEYCVAATARDAQRLGLKTYIIEDAVQGIARDISTTIKQLNTLGIRFIASDFIGDA